MLTYQGHHSAITKNLKCLEVRRSNVGGRVMTARPKIKTWTLRFRLLERRGGESKVVSGLGIVILNLEYGPFLARTFQQRSRGYLCNKVNIITKVRRQGRENSPGN